jgi:hypothetical protein
LFVEAPVTLQVQKLLTKHKAEIQAVQQAAAEETRRLLDVAGAQHELALRQLKERLAKVCSLVNPTCCRGRIMVPMLS